MNPRERRRIIRKVATEAHEWALNLRGSHRIYSDLCGACVVTAAYTLKRLLEEGVTGARFCLGNGHAYVRVGRLLVDSTGGQFGFPPVWVHASLPPRSSVHPASVYTDEAEATTVEQAMLVMENAGWDWDAERIQRLVIEDRKKAA